MSQQVIVAGIGNIFFGDDGFGPTVARRLQARTLPPQVYVTDYGIRALHLAYALVDRPDLLILVDTVDRGGAPGDLYIIEPSFDAAVGATADAHGMDIQSVFQLLRTLGGAPPTTRLVGCQPHTVSEGIGLTPPVRAAVDVAVERCRELVSTEHHAQLQRAER